MDSTDGEGVRVVGTGGGGGVEVLIMSISISMVAFLEGTGLGASIVIETSSLEEASTFAVVEEEAGAACFWKEWDSCMRIRG